MVDGHRTVKMFLCEGEFQAWLNYYKRVHIFNFLENILLLDLFKCFSLFSYYNNIIRSQIEAFKLIYYITSNTSIRLFFILYYIILYYIRPIFYYIITLNK